MDASHAYHGQIKDGLFHGHGTLIYSGNEKYEVSIHSAFSSLET